MLVSNKAKQFICKRTISQLSMMFVNYIAAYEIITSFKNKIEHAITKEITLTDCIYQLLSKYVSR